MTAKLLPLFYVSQVHTINYNHNYFKKSLNDS